MVDARGSSFVVENPSEGTSLCSFNAATTSILAAAVDAAQDVQKRRWGRLPPLERSITLRRLGGLVQENKEKFAMLEAVCSGMCIRDARESMDSCAQCFDIAASLSLAHHGSVLRSFTHNGRQVSSTTRVEPLGVCAFITPSNYPLELGIWKMAFSLAAGNTVVWKPPESAPLTAMFLGELMTQNGVDVVNIVHGGSDVGTLLSTHKNIDLVGFTGSRAVGQQVLNAASSTSKRVQLELGGNSSLIYDGTTSVSSCVTLAMQCFSNSGQSCTAIRRCFVPRDKLWEFLETLVARITLRSLGHALEPLTEQGPMHSGRALQKVLDAIGDATKLGAEIVVGGCRAIFPGGYFMSPTILLIQKHLHHLVQEETFGPVLCVIPYDPVDVVEPSASEKATTCNLLSMCNSTTYALSSVVCSNDAAFIERCTQQIAAGTLWVNTVDAMNATTPFGGVRAGSGFGKDLGLDALTQYSNIKVVTTCL